VSLSIEFYASGSKAISTSFFLTSFDTLTGVSELSEKKHPDHLNGLLNKNLSWNVEKAEKPGLLEKLEGASKLKSRHVLRKHGE